jgi:hypothetical protein
MKMAARTAVLDLEIKVDKKKAKEIMLSPKRKKVRNETATWV